MESVNATTWRDAVLCAQRPVLVQFTAEWCGPCKLMKPILEQAAAELNGQVKVFALNVDESHEIANEYNISSVPTFLLFKDGKVVNSKVGRITKQSLVEMLQS